MKLDRIDFHILNILQQDSTLSVSAISEKVGISSTPCWRRIQALEKAGYIRKKVALLDAKMLDLGVTVFVSIKTSVHNPNWLEKFRIAVMEIP